MTRRCSTIAAALILLLTPLAGSAQERGGGAQKEREVAAFADDRMSIVLSEGERAFIRREMRGLLGGLQEILEASAAGDRARVVKAARAIGMNGPEKDHIPKSLAPKLPPEFRQLGLATHRGFDRIAADAEQHGAGGAPKQLGELMRNCAACHGTWRIVGEGGR
ncbi:MAG: hypothetical protein ACK4UO_09080 [Pseudolabrys sp.]